MVKKFKYKLTFDWHICYCHAFDEKNNLRHTLSSIEYTWMTYWWKCWVFAFILTILEVNAFLILRYFVYCGLHQEVTPVLLYFCQKLTGQLINNILIGEREEMVQFLS